MFIIHLLVVFKRLESVEWPGLNLDCVLDNESLIYEYSCSCTNFSKSLETTESTIGLPRSVYNCRDLIVNPFPCKWHLFLLP